MEQITNLEEFSKTLENIKYGWLDINKNIYYTDEKGFKKKYTLSTPEEVLSNQVGTCYDLVELERHELKNLNIKANSYFMIYYESKRNYNHTFLVYEANEKFYWVEYALEHYRGIHEYDSLFDLLTSAREEFKKSYGIKYMDLDYLCIYKYKKPKFHIGLKDFIKHCENGENVII